MKKETKKGVGKPTLFTKPMKRVNVMLDPETIKFYTEHGGGNLSEGIRRHWRGLTKRAVDGACPVCKGAHVTAGVYCFDCGMAYPPRR